MAKKCGQLGQIERRVKTSFIVCHKQRRKVRIAVTEQGNYCMDTECPYSPSNPQKK